MQHQAPRSRHGSPGAVGSKQEVLGIVGRGREQLGVT